MRPLLDRSATRTAVAVAVLCLLPLAACSGGRPTTDELESGLTANTSPFPVAEQQAGCAAEILIDSDLSDDVLRAVADAEADLELSGDDASVLASLQVEVLQNCAG